MILEDKMNYLKTAEVNGGEVVTFLDEGIWKESKIYKYEDETPRKDFYIKIHILDIDKHLRLNVTNREVLKEAFSKDTINWIGKKATLSKEKIMVGGKKMDSVVVTPIV